MTRDELVLHEAEGWSRDGFWPIPVHAGSKKPVGDGWQHQRLTLLDLPSKLEKGSNIGVLLGIPPRVIVDVDCDSPEAIACAKLIRGPETHRIFGRRSKSCSHYLFELGAEFETMQFKDLDGKMIAEMRGKAGNGNPQQTVVPGSMHESGEAVVWAEKRDFGKTTVPELYKWVAKIASAAMLAKHWPAAGARHDPTLALAGWFAINGWDKVCALELILAAADAAGDRKQRDRTNEVTSTFERFASGRGDITQRKALEAAFSPNGKQVTQKLAAWLELDRRVVDDQTVGKAKSKQTVRQGLGGVSLQHDAPAWPKPLAAEAFYGLAGEVARAIEPHTEADLAGLLIQFLAAFGNVVGGSPHFRVEADRHRANLFVVLVGVTSVARKGTSLGHIRRVFQTADPEWASSRVLSGLSSGEGLIWAVRDPIEKREAVRQKGRTVGYETVTADHGVSDKRALIIETEFSSPLRVADREGNTLSAIVRDAWDTGDLCTLTKNSPARATGAHITIIGHVTREELLRYMNSTEMGNGFANRFLWACVRRSKCLPDGGSFQIEEHSALLKRLADCIQFARSAGEVTRDRTAGGIWRTVYEKLSAGRPGLLGSIISRAPAQVVRLCLLFALLDCSAVIREQHMLAALAVWDYCEESARFIFGDSLGYPEADRILGELRANPQGLTRTNIRDIFGRNRSEAEIEAALRCLTERSLAVRETRKTDGRSAEVWTAVGTTETTDTT